MLRELVLARGDGKARLRRSHPGEALPAADRIGKFGPAQIGQLGLVVEQIHLRRGPRLKQVDHPFGFGCEVGKAGQASGSSFLSGQPLGSASQRQDLTNHFQSVQASWTRTLTSSLLNRTSYSFNNFKNATTPLSVGPELDFPSLADGSSYRVPQQTRQKRSQFADNLDWIRGRHNFHFGGEFQRGTAIEFPNQDNIYHNVFSLSSGNSFDLGLYNSGGEAKAHTFNEPGAVDVYCNIHPQMAASVLVVPNKLFAKVKADGSYEIPGVPTGRRKVVAWAPGSRLNAEWVEVGAGSSVDLNLKLDSKAPAHKNKSGQSYGSYE